MTEWRVAPCRNMFAFRSGGAQRRGREMKTGTTIAVAAGLFAALFGWGPPAAADPIEISARFVRPNGSPFAGLDVRIVVGSERASRSPNAGKRMRTNGSGRVTYAVDAPVRLRSITLDNVFVRHPSHLIEVGVEMELVGRKALYWIELDLVRAAGPGVTMTAYVQAGDGGFTRPLSFRNHSWSFPDQPGGMLMTSIGADIRRHDMTGTPGGRWKVDLVIEKQEFSVR